MDMHVVLASDDGYAPYMGTCILSLMENNAECFDAIHVSIIDNGISEQNRKKLMRQSDQFPNVTTSFFDLSYRFGEVHPLVENGWAHTIYGRFFLEDVVEESVEKVLYLDCDTTVKGSLEELMSIDMEDYCVAGVIDISEKMQKESLEMEPSAHYINSGVMLVNMKMWRQLKIQEKLIKFVNTYPKKLLCPDQDAVNVVCGKMTRIVPVKYNFGWMLSERRLKWDYEKADFYYSYEELYDTVKDSYKNVVVFHYFGKLKPWRKAECTDEFSRAFLYYYKKSLWYQKLKFASKKKMLEYYFLRRPRWELIRLTRCLLGIKRYDQICDALNRIRLSQSRE